VAQRFNELPLKLVLRLMQGLSQIHEKSSRYVVNSLKAFAYICEFLCLFSERSSSLFDNATSCVSRRKVDATLKTDLQPRVRIYAKKLTSCSFGEWEERLTWVERSQSLAVLCAGFETAKETQGYIG
jgi:hypothetical protein